jgi:hypothetical protein
VTLAAPVAKARSRWGKPIGEDHAIGVKVPEMPSCIMHLERFEDMFLAVVKEVLPGYPLHQITDQRNGDIRIFVLGSRRSGAELILRILVSARGKDSLHTPPLGCNLSTALRQ